MNRRICDVLRKLQLHKSGRRQHGRDQQRQQRGDRRQHQKPTGRVHGGWVQGHRGRSSSSRSSSRRGRGPFPGSYPLGWAIPPADDEAGLGKLPVATPHDEKKKKKKRPHKIATFYV